MFSRAFLFGFLIIVGYVLIYILLPETDKKDILTLLKEVISSADMKEYIKSVAKSLIS